MKLRFPAGCCIGFVLLAACGPVQSVLAQKSVPLIDHSRIHGVIVVADQPEGKAVEAAGIIQQYLYRMSRQIVPIQTVREYQNDRRRPQMVVLVGPSSMTEEMGIKIDQDQNEGEHYVIKTDSEKGRVALVGNDAGELRSTIFAVYDLLDRLGCGWYGPEELWQVIPEARQISIPPLDLEVRPAFIHRSIWLVVDPQLKDAWRMGGVRFGHGHALKGVAQRARYEEEHPEWYGPGQPSLTHPEIIKISAETCRERIANIDPDGIAPLSICANDGPGFAERDSWAGNNSSQMLYYANALSKELQKTDPGRYILTFYAYWYTHDEPRPMRQAEPGVCAMQVNEGDHLKPWDWPEPAEVYRTTGRSNTREVKAFEAWRATGAQLAIYEWWIPWVGHNVWRVMPWYPLETTLRNYRYWQKGGVRYISHECKNEGYPLRWVLYYVGARGMWEPDLTVEQILKPACRKLYGPVADDMYNYYRVFEKATLASKLTGENWRLPDPQLIYTPDYEAEASKHITAATIAAAASKNEKIIARVAAERQIWEKACQTLAELRQNPTVFHQVYVDGKRMRISDGKIKAKDIGELFGIDERLVFYAVEADGSKRQLDPQEVIDLSKQNQFSVIGAANRKWQKLWPELGQTPRRSSGERLLSPQSASQACGAD